jgi:hypothetical protein
VPAAAHRPAPVPWLGALDVTRSGSGAAAIVAAATNLGAECALVADLGLADREPRRLADREPHRPGPAPWTAPASERHPEPSTPLLLAATNRTSIGSW